MNIKRSISLFVLLTAILSACSATATQAPSESVAAAEPTQAPAATEVASEVAAQVAEADKAVSDLAQATPRMIIRNATLTLVVRDTQTQLDAVMHLAGELKGFVTSSITSRDGVDLQAHVVLRVPSERMDEALQRVRALAVEVREEIVSGDDVTAEYVDLSSRLKNLEAAEEQLRTILAQASQTEDVLKVFEQLKNVRGEIEQAKGRMQYLAQSAAMATLSLTLLPDKPAQPVEAPGWRPEGVAKSALETLIGSLQGLANAGIWLALYILPMASLVLAPLVIVILLLRLRSRRRAAALQPPAQ